ncbi:MAG: PAS domain-containing sensor histidine kinase [Aestuariibacter sp.]
MAQVLANNQFDETTSDDCVGRKSADHPFVDNNLPHSLYFEGHSSQHDTITRVLQAIPAGVVLLDNHGCVQVANKIAVDLLGEPLEQQPWRDIIERAFKPRKDDGLEISLVDGRRIKLSVSSIPGYAGQLIHLTDLTETRALQSKVSHMQKLYSLGKMVASLAHQIRTPLSAAMLYAANLNNPTVQPNAIKRFSGKLLNRLKDLESQVNDMLLFARSDTQQVVEQINVQPFLQNTLADCSEAARAQGSQISLLPSDEPLLILGNTVALKGALHNLIHNALEIGGRDTQIQLSASASDEEISITVSDNGPGIKVAHFSQLFEPFYTTRPQGTGLGLAVVHSVARSHQGRVFARNNISGGASFQIILPRQSGQLSKHETDIQDVLPRHSKTKELKNTTSFCEHKSRQYKVGERI